MANSTEYWILDTGYWILDPDTGLWTLDLDLDLDLAPALRLVLRSIPKNLIS